MEVVLFGRENELKSHLDGVSLVSKMRLSGK